MHYSRIGPIKSNAFVFFIKVVNQVQDKQRQTRKEIMFIHTAILFIFKNPDETKSISRIIS